METTWEQIAKEGATTPQKQKLFAQLKDSEFVTALINNLPMYAAHDLIQITETYGPEIVTVDETERIEIHQTEGKPETPCAVHPDLQPQ